MSSSFKVSVITSLYNYQQYIGQCIESFLNQDFVDSEMVIVDDCSTDNSYSVVKKYEGPRVRYIRLPKKGNYSIAKNVGIKNARSDVLVMLDADDMFTKTGISTRYNKLMEGYDFVHGPCLILKNGSTYRASVWNGYLRTKFYRHIHAQTVMLLKDIHRKIGLYDEELWSKSDYEMWARIHNHGFKVSWVTEDVSIYRMHPLQMHISKDKVKNYLEITRSVDEKIEKRKIDLSDLEMLE